ncbi:putative FAD-linked oxidoreductase [Methyloligella halotolerans]|uniref:Putative FAD-linked oxidoreductase n=1 Tax=Methyloligella halotolerans TaxID=1177755 RepID=A0A1E2RY89_9HYPH|nr:glycolate oxidase subunit GlcE [Methyloligella halotolerans]ODA67184.1 putative FAD-linked oxidoreductase [Methyloligella halotolerans]
MQPRFHAPETVEDLADLLLGYAQEGLPVEVRGLGSKLGYGRPVQTAAVVSTEKFDEITLYEPSELVLSAGSGTPLAKIEKLLDENGQQLAFEPFDLPPVLGGKPGEGSIGGVFATGLSGSRRVLSGAARDHILGVKAVNGRGEAFKAGGRVMKNVTGYDLSKLLTGSCGTLSVLTEITMKVLPKPEQSSTLLFFDVPEAAAIELLCKAMGSPFEVSGAAHLQPGLAAGLSDKPLRERAESVTALRVEGFEGAVRYRAAKLKQKFAAFSDLTELSGDRSRRFWSDIRQVRPLQSAGRPLWRISTAPSRAADLVAALRHTIDLKALYDWSGGQIWLETGATSDANAVELRRILADFGGYATLVRAEPGIRASADVFQPLEMRLMEITRALKASFDPAGILNPGRMYSGV